MNFGEPWWLWVLAGVGVLALILVLTAINPRLRAARWPRIARVAASAGGVKPTAPGRPGRRPWFLLLAAAGTILALAHPRWGKIDEPVVEQAREVMIALDLSRSMLVADVPPLRLERAKLLTKNLLDSLRGERVGLIVFAGTAFVQVPLSADYQILHEFLPELNPAYMPQGGTDYDGMLRAALGGFGSDEQADRFLIVLSDGESQTDTWRERLPELRERGVQALTLGLGTPAGGFIPDGDGAYLKDERGAVVLSRLETGTLQALATETRGTFRNASEWVDLPALLEATVARARQGRFTTRRNERFLERFQWFLAPAVLLGLVGLWREVIVRPRPQNVRRARETAPATRTVATMATALLLMGLLRPDAHAADATPPPPPAPDARVRETIARLAATPQPTARDWRELADRTLVYGSGARMQQQELAPGAIQDALAAVDLGQQANPQLTDWDKLRKDLSALLDIPPEEQPPPEDQQQQQDQSKSDEEQKQDQQNQSDQQQQQQDKNESDQDSSEQQSQDQKQQQDSSGQSQDQEPPEPQPAQPEEGQMGEMKPQEEPTEAPSEADTPPEPPKTRKIGARPADNPPPPTDAESALLQQRMRETADKDSPARLFQLLEGTDKQPAPRGRDW